MRKKITSSSDLINLEDVTATAALSKVSNTRRRKLLTAGAGLVASAAAPTGIGLVGLALPDAAHAISVIKATLDGYKIIWQEPGEGTLVNKAGIRSRNFSAIAFKDNTFFYGTYEKRMFLPPLNIVYVHKFIPFSEAKLFWNKPAYQWMVEFRVKNILRFARKRDRLLNPLTCGATWSKPGSDYQHRELVPAWNPDMPEAEVRQRRKLALLRAFYDWIVRFCQEESRGNIFTDFHDFFTHVHEDVGGILLFVLGRQQNVREANQNLPEAQRQPIPEPEEILDLYFNVEDVLVAPTAGNEPPLYYRAVVHRVRRPETGRSNFPGYRDGEGRSSANTYHIEMVHRVESPGIIYSTMVTRYSLNSTGLEQTIPYLPERQLEPRLASVDRAEGRYRAAVNRLMDAIPNEEIRAAVYNMQTELYSARIGHFIAYALTPLVLVAYVMGSRTTLPQTDSRAANFDVLSAVLVAVSSELMKWVVGSSLEIYRFFYGEDDGEQPFVDNFQIDNNNGWRWYNQHFDDSSAPHRRLIGYTYDVRDTYSPPAVKRWTIKMNHNPVISSQAKSAGGSVFTSVPSSCAEGDSLTIRFKASGTSAEVTFRIAEPQLKTYNVFIAQPPQRFQVSATKDDATKTYTISAWLTLI